MMHDRIISQETQYHRMWSILEGEPGGVCGLETSPGKRITQEMVTRGIRESHPWAFVDKLRMLRGRCTEPETLMGTVPGKSGCKCPAALRHRTYCRVEEGFRDGTGR